MELINNNKWMRSFRLHCTHFHLLFLLAIFTNGFQSEAFEILYKFLKPNYHQLLGLALDLFYLFQKDNLTFLDLRSISTGLNIYHKPSTRILQTGYQIENMDLIWM